ncbi:hypothetical protein CABS01_00029 [Colletotrichum abscissum]|uniref:uncharacterized protein n=1 Tax=Colletotrichum abscissum TaxID=1671311 RepID=UPI0027D70986|nr:uncharacterized protein CABS01_00029 [Colletotrichum abscissum]KAK1524940.1 hypothetical protein CABS01_00029 [Colletotrichum abscissum]
MSSLSGTGMGTGRLTSLFRATESGPASLYLAAGPLFTAQMVIGSTGSTAKLLETGWRPPNHRQLLDVDVARVVASCPAPASWEQTRLFPLCLRQTWGLPRFFDTCTYHGYIVPAICSFTTLGPHSLSPSHACINTDGYFLSDIHPSRVPYATTDTYAQIETKRRLPICTPMLTRRLVHPLLLSHFL